MHVSSLHSQYPFGSFPSAYLLVRTVKYFRPKIKIRTIGRLSLPTLTSIWPWLTFFERKFRIVETVSIKISVSWSSEFFWSYFSKTLNCDFEWHSLKVIFWKFSKNIFPSKSFFNYLAYAERRKNKGFCIPSSNCHSKRNFTKHDYQD